MASLLAGLPGVVATLALLHAGDQPVHVAWSLGALVAVCWLAALVWLLELGVRPLQTLANLLAAMREEDFSFRGRAGAGDDALLTAMREANALADTLREQRLGALEATALLRKVMEEVDVAVFAFDEGQRLRLVNRAGTAVLAEHRERLLGRTAEELGLGQALGADGAGIVDLALPGASGRWEVRRSSFREKGLPHQLLVLANVSLALRQEERLAWQRLIRVLGHELNNSLAPIRSIAESLQGRLPREPRPDGWEEDARRGLGVIRDRAAALGRFMEGYSRLARLPPPTPREVDLAALLERVARTETRLAVAVEPSPPLSLQADPDQLEQLLINLVRNATDAALETGGGVWVSWSRSSGRARAVEIRVEDEGPGLSGSANLFVPFFTTKPRGSGIGLVLARQIAEAHGGHLTLESRGAPRGCVARLRLPLAG